MKHPRVAFPFKNAFERSKTATINVLPCFKCVFKHLHSRKSFLSAVDSGHTVISTAPLCPCIDLLCNPDSNDSHTSTLVVLSLIHRAF